MKRFCLLALVTFYAIVIFEIAQKAKPILQHDFNNSDVFTVMMKMGEFPK